MSENERLENLNVHPEKSANLAGIPFCQHRSVEFSVSLYYLASRASFSMRLILSISFAVQRGCMPILFGLQREQERRLLR